MYAWLKALHVIGVISWMAGLLYLSRLFVYHAMETEKVVMDRLQVMERRLMRGIANPAAAISIVAGLAMLWQMPVYLDQWWMRIKLVLVAVLLVIHAMAISY